MKFTTRELTTLAVFGVLWGIVEMTLGTVLKSLNIPFSGAVLASIGLTMALIGRLFVSRRGSTLFIGVIAVILKLFSLGGIILGPMVGIMSEALIAELILSMGDQPRRRWFLLAGSAGVTWAMVQPLVTNPLLFGRSLITVWLNLLDQGSRYLGIDTDAAVLIVVLMATIHLILGATAGWFAWNTGQELQSRMGKKPAQSRQVIEHQAKQYEGS